MAAVLERAGARTRVRHLGTAALVATVEAMRAFTARRERSTPDELWLVEHPPVYTLGQGADLRHGPRIDNGIPIVSVERGGEITYHGPGQIVMYTLIDLARRGIKVREFVALLEACVIDLLAEEGVGATRRTGAPGVYVRGAKIAALGLRVTRGCTWHGVALNVDADLAPFAAIDPCGYEGLAVTRTRDLGIQASAAQLGDRLARKLEERLDHA